MKRRRGHHIPPPFGGVIYAAYPKWVLWDVQPLVKSSFSPVPRNHFLGRGGGQKNHLKERLLDQAQVPALYTPLFEGHSHSIPQGMIFDVQPLVKSLFCPIRPSPNGFFDSEASIP